MLFSRGEPEQAQLLRNSSEDFWGRYFWTPPVWQSVQEKSEYSESI